MSRVFFTSDLHFGHDNLTKSLRCQDWDTNLQLICKNWNNTVSKRDIVYILGDISMEKPAFCNTLSELNGTIIVVGGNHDDKRCCKRLMEMGIITMGTLVYKRFLCTHVPVHPSQLAGFRGNIHGHIHLSGIIDGLGSYNPPQIEGPYYNVNTEFHNYTPILYNDIEEWFKNRNQNDSRTIS